MNIDARSLRRRAVTLLLTGMLGAYLLGIFWLNFSITPSFYITDMYADVIVAQKMWLQKTIVPENWVFSNQLYVVATPALAALFMGVFTDPYVAMAAASSVMALLVVGSFLWMLRPVCPSLAARLVGAVVFLALPVLSGDAVKVMNGWQLLFTMCSYYACYAIHAFLLFGFYIRSAKPSAAVIALCGLLSFALGIQSLRQTAVALLPLAAMEALAMIQRLRRREPVCTRKTLFVLVSGQCNLAGVLVYKLLDPPQADMLGEMGLTPLRQIPAAALEGLQHILGLFYRDCSQPLPKFLAALGICVLLALAYFLWNQKKLDRPGRLLAGLLVLSVGCILAAEIVLTMRMRSIYYFMLFPLLGCLAAWVFQQGGLRTKTLCLVLLCAVYGFSWESEIYPQCRFALDQENDPYYAISADLTAGGYTTVYSSWNRCEGVAVATRDRIQAGFWTEDATPFEPVNALRDPAVYEEDAEHAAYLFCGEEDARIGLERAAAAGVEMTLIGRYDYRDISVYAASENLLQLFSQ